MHLRFLIAAVAVPAALWGQSIVVKPVFQAGQTLHLELKKTREDSRTPAVFAATTPVTAKVLSVDANGAVLHWAYGETSMSDHPMAKSPLVRAAMDAVKGLRLEVMLNEDGAFKGLRNESEVVGRLTAMTDVMAKGFVDQIPAGQREQFMAIFKQVAAPQVLLASATRDVSLYFGISGAELDAGRPVRAPIEIPNPVGGAGTLKGHVVFELTSKNDASGEAAIELSQQFDPGDVAAMMKQFMQQAGVPHVEGQKLPAVQFSDKATYLIDLKSTLVRGVSHVRTIDGVPGLKRIDSTAVRLVRVEQP